MTERDPMTELRLNEIDALFELSPMLVRVVDLGGRLQRANPSALAEFTESPPETLRALWERRAPRLAEGGDSVPFVRSPGMRALGGATVRGDLLCVDGADGEERFLDSSAAPVRDAQQQVVGALLLDVDVTSRVHSTRAAREQRMGPTSRAASPKAPSSEVALAAIAHVTSKVLHDVNNALNPIMSATYLLEHHAESPDTVRHYAELIRRATEAGSAIASRLGRFLRQERLHDGGGELIQIGALVNEVLSVSLPFDRQHPNDQSGPVLRRDIDETLTVRGIRDDLRHALQCLLQNALEAMPANGALQVRVERDGDSATITVADNGVGMSDEVRARAFEPFYSSKTVPGAGLSLAEVYSVAERHGGAVAIASTLGRGTTVSMRLPTVTVGTPPVGTDPTPVAPSSVILVVEDHDDSREFLSRVLVSNGHRVDAVASCAEARKRLAAVGVPIYNLLLTDVSLPDGSGWELLTFAKRHHPMMRVGVVTGWEQTGDGEAVGAEFVLTKPLRAAELLERVAGRRTTQASE